MQILPAIDLRGGQCVRLRQGDYSRETVFGSDPAEMARDWVRQGASALHLVDLDGAKQGAPVNDASIRSILAAVKVPCQLGGGLRTTEHVAQALGWGVARVVLGTAALKEPAWFEQVVQQFPGKVVLGLDARDGRVATDGWLEISNDRALDLAQRYESLPLAALVYTDISRDGMLKGANVEAMAEMARAVRLPVIASGGVAELEDVRRLSGIGLAGCIIGRALYDNRFRLAEAIQTAELGSGKL